MKRIIQFSIVLASSVIISCNGNGNGFDASGTFEADETIVSSEMAGKLLSFNVEEGMQLSKDSIIGMVDATNINLQQQQVEASIRIAVVLPAPFAPRNPKISPLCTSKLILSTATNSPKRLVKLSAVITLSFIIRKLLADSL